MEIHGLKLSPARLEAMAEHAERDYPSEACGVILGRPDSPELERVAPLKNVQDRYHRLDPKAFPRDAKDAFRIDELERMRLLEEAELQGLVERVLYHSHCDAGAYFSPEDRAMAVQDGQALMPGVVHVVISVRQGRRADAAAFRYDADSGSFLEARIPPALLGLEVVPDPLPRLELRQLEGREASRPIRPYGGSLAPRLVSPEEVEPLLALCEGPPLVLDGPACFDLEAFGAGAYSPLEGFLRRAELRSISQRGRLISGAPWREPVTLVLPRTQVPKTLEVGSVVALHDKTGQARGVLALTELYASKDRVTLAGPVYVFPRPGYQSAAHLRAGLLGTGAQRVLGLGRAPEGLDLSGFDAVLAGPAAPQASPVSLLTSLRSSWLTAVMAQNQGATHLCLSEPERAEWISDEALAIELWPKV